MCRHPASCVVELTAVRARLNHHSTLSTTSSTISSKKREDKTPPAFFLRRWIKNRQYTDRGSFILWPNEIKQGVPYPSNRSRRCGERAEDVHFVPIVEARKSTGHEPRLDPILVDKRSGTPRELVVGRWTK